MKLLILGANGMLGNACMNYFHRNAKFQVKGTIRSELSLNLFPSNIRSLIIPNIDILNAETQDNLFDKERPDVIINCIGIVKQAAGINDPLCSIALNSLLPHQLSIRCEEYGSRFIHISTDCVFSGLKGSPYLESDNADATDLYGKTKFLGEIAEKSNVLTLRTSYIGNELQGANGLLEWFLSQECHCKGFTNAIYSGIPSVILVQILGDILLRHPYLSGLYHVASEPISKYNLLELIAKVFKKHIKIIPDDSVKINRSLISSRFNDATGFICPSWEEMIEKMYKDRITNVQR